MKNFFNMILMVILGFILSKCGGGSAQGGSEFGNPTTRSLVGTVVSSGSSNISALKASTEGSCPADQAVATSSNGETTLASVQTADCSFDLDLVTGKSYAISFSLEDTFVATLIVTNAGSSFTSSVVYIASGSTAINLGQVVILNGEALPENEPLEENDRDEDGQSDFDDSDDDGDGISDDDEADCDLDGFLDDDDEDEAECETEDDSDDEQDETSAVVREVEPRNNATNIDLDREIRVRLNCEVDETTVNNTSFAIVATGDVIECQFEISEDEIRCEHEDQDFLPNTLYTATLTGIACTNDSIVSTTSWSWTTEEDD